MALMRFDPFRELDRWTEQALAGTRNLRPMPMEALRRGDHFLVALDLPDVAQDDTDVTVERNVVTVRATASRSPRGRRGHRRRATGRQLGPFRAR